MSSTVVIVVVSFAPDTVVDASGLNTLTVNPLLFCMLNLPLFDVEIPEPSIIDRTSPTATELKEPEENV